MPALRYRQISVLGLNLADVDYEKATMIIAENLFGRKPFSVQYINSYLLLETVQNPELRNALLATDMTFEDGTGMYLASRILYGDQGFAKRINATDMNYAILSLCEREGYPVYFFGGDPNAIIRLTDKLRQKFPSLKVAGYKDRNQEFDAEAVQAINNSGAKVLMLGLGTPTQEFAASKWKSSLTVPIVITIGSFIEFLTDFKPRAPKLMRLLGLEWFHRLLLNPKRLWKRYLFGNPYFLWLVLREKFLKTR